MLCTSKVPVPRQGRWPLQRIRLALGGEGWLGIGIVPMSSRLAREAYPTVHGGSCGEHRTWKHMQRALFDLMLHKVTEMDLSRGVEGGELGVGSVHGSLCGGRASAAVSRRCSAKPSRGLRRVGVRTGCEGGGQQTAAGRSAAGERSRRPCDGIVGLACECG